MTFKEDKRFTGEKCPFCNGTGDDFEGEIPWCPKCGGTGLEFIEEIKEPTK